MLLALIDTIKRMKEQLTQIMLQNKGETTNSLNALANELTRKEQRLESLVGSSKEYTLLEVQKLIQQTAEKVNSLEDLASRKAEVSDFQNKVSDIEQKLLLLPDQISAALIKTKLETLRDEERLDISAIKGIEKLLDKLVKEAAKKIPASTHHVVERVSMGQYETPIKAGSNVTVTKNAQGAYVISSTGVGDGGSATTPFQETLTGTGTSFTLTHTPNETEHKFELYLNGQRRFDFSFVGTTLTTTFSKFSTDELVVVYNF